MSGLLSANLFQLAYVSDDLHQAAAWLQRHLGASEFEFPDRLSLPDVVVDGAPSRWVIDQAFTQLGEIQIEIIKPVDGAVDMYRGVLVAGAPASFHHVGIRVDTWAEAELARERFGLPWTTRGRTPGVCDFGYLDVRHVVGHYVEFLYLEPAVLAAIEARRNASGASA